MRDMLHLMAGFALAAGVLVYFPADPGDEAVRAIALTVAGIMAIVAARSVDPKD